jgi:hypothetical protein
MNIAALIKLLNSRPNYPATNGSDETLAVEQFASDNGFQHTLHDPSLVVFDYKAIKTTPAWLGVPLAGIFKDAYQVVRGEYLGFDITIFNYIDNVSKPFLSNGWDLLSPESRSQLTKGIVRIKLPKTFPQIVLDSNKNDRYKHTSGLMTSYQPDQRLSLEGDFDAYFDLFVPRNLQINALSLLAPNLMQILKDSAILFDIEYYGDEMILMTDSYIYDPASMEVLSRALDEQLKYIQRLLQSWNYMPVNQPFDLLKKQAVFGGVTKIGPLRISATASMVISLILFAAVAAFIIIFGK